MPKSSTGHFLLGLCPTGNLGMPCRLSGPSPSGLGSSHSGGRQAASFPALTQLQPGLNDALEFRCCHEPHRTPLGLERGNAMLPRATSCTSRAAQRQTVRCGPSHLEHLWGAETGSAMCHEPYRTPLGQCGTLMLPRAHRAPSGTPGGTHEPHTKRRTCGAAVLERTHADRCHDHKTCQSAFSPRTGDPQAEPVRGADQIRCLMMSYFGVENPSMSRRLNLKRSSFENAYGLAGFQSLNIES